MRTYSRSAGNGATPPARRRAITTLNSMAGGIAPTISNLAKIAGVSRPTMQAAANLTPLERADVLAGKRPLVERKPKPAEPEPLTVESIVKWFDAIATTEEQIRLAHLIGTFGGARSDIPIAAGNGAAAHT